MIVKHSQRMNRKPCRKCGDTQVWWGHDTDKPGRRPCNDARCPCSGGNVSWLLIDRASAPHVCLPTNDPERYPDAPSVPEVTTEAPTVPGIVPQVIPDLEPAQPGTHKVCAECKTVQPAGQLGHHTEECSHYLAPGAPAKTDDRVGALSALLDLLGPKVDREEVEGIVRDTVATLSLPTVVKVDRQGEVVEVEGTTHAALADVLTALASGEHVMMVGPAGTGKSTIAHQCANALERAFYSISLSPQTPASSLLGYNDATGRHVRSLFREPYEHGGLFLFDEIDNGHPSILAVMNSALANGVMAFPDGMVNRHPDFLCVASANTFGRGADRQYVGRSPIDAATLDRFTVSEVLYDHALEDTLAAATGYGSWSKVVGIVRALRANADEARMTVVVSPRASVGMCRLLAQGMTWDKAVSGRLRRGLSDADWSKLSNGVRVSL